MNELNELDESEDVDDLAVNALRLIAGANVLSSKELLNAADYIAYQANNDYYDDAEGAVLLKQIAAYLRHKGYVNE